MHLGAATSPPHKPVSGKVNPQLCTYISGMGYWPEYPGGTDREVDLWPQVYSCTGYYLVDSINYDYYYWWDPSKPKVTLNDWWFYTNCGDWRAAMEGHLHVILWAGNYEYVASIGLRVSNLNHFDQDSSYTPGGQWSACM